MKQPKALFVLNIIIFVILILCLLFDAFLVVSMIDAKLEIENNPNGDNFGHGLGMAILFVLHMYLCIPYFICLVISIVSMCKKYFNWLSIANASMCGVAILATVVVFLII